MSLEPITSIVLGIVFAIYILLKKEDLSRQFKKLAKAYLPEKKQKTLEEISSLSNKTFGNFCKWAMPRSINYWYSLLYWYVDITNSLRCNNFCFGRIHSFNTSLWSLHWNSGRCFSKTYGRPRKSLNIYYLYYNTTATRR